MQTSIRGLSPQADGFRRHSNTEASVVGSLTNLTQCIPRVSPMRTASDYQTPAVPYHTLICRSFSTPNTALVRKNAEYITNTEHIEMWGLASPPHPHGSAGRFTPIGRMRKGGCAAGLPGFYREDAKERAAKSVRDRFTALLRSGLSTASVAFTSRRSRARCSKWAHFHFSSASVCNNCGRGS